LQITSIEGSGFNEIAYNKSKNRSKRHKTLIDGKNREGFNIEKKLCLKNFWFWQQELIKKHKTNIYCI